MRILIVDERQERAHALQTWLAGEADMQVTGCVTSLTEAFEAGGHNDLLLLQRAEKVEPARRLVRMLASAYPQLKVLVVGVREDDWDNILPYLESGAAGYVTAAELDGNGGEAQPLLDKLRAAFRNEALVSPRVAALIMRRIAQVARRHRQGSASIVWPAGQNLTTLSAD